MQQPTQQVARVCVAGCGHWGKNLVRNFHQLGKLAGVCDVDPARAQALAGQYAGTQVYQTFDEVLGDRSVNAVVIATPAEQHASMTIAALNAGKDVFVEKPLALYPEHGKAMVDAARQNHRLPMVG